MIFPKSLARSLEAVLLWNHNLRHRLPWILFGIPHFSSILNRLIFQVLAQLELEQIVGLIVCVEFL